MFNPPGSDSPNEYIELRGLPNYLFPAGSYLLVIEGDATSNPGLVQNRFDLSGQRIGGNGFLLLLQKNAPYTTVFGSTVLANSGSGSGWGSGSSSSIGHSGEDDSTTLEDPSFTCFLIQSSIKPQIGDDIDSDDNGVPDGALFAAWTVFDSVGSTDAGGAGDFAYGALSFRRSDPPGNTASVSGAIVPIGFTPDYIGRVGNSTGYTANEWVAGEDLEGSLPNWRLGNTLETAPSFLADFALNMIGGPNFGDTPFPGVIAEETARSTVISEGGASDSYTLSLNTPPGGPVTIRIDAGSQIQISVDNGATYGNTRTAIFPSTALLTVLVRAPENNIVDVNPYLRTISHTITATGDPASYPTTSLMPAVTVRVTENDSLLLNELKVNPPGEDHPFEFVEISGTPGAFLTNVYFVGIEGDSEDNPGTASPVIDLSSMTIGNNGLLVIVPAGHPYAIPPDTSILIAPQLSLPGDGLQNGSASFWLISSPVAIDEGEDLDQGDNGVLERLPDGTTLLDAVAWLDSGTNDLAFGGVQLTQATGIPDAAARFPGNSSPLSADAWFSGDLLGVNGDTLNYDETSVGPDFPFGTVVTPGIQNNTAPVISPIAPLSGVIGDPTHPEIVFLVSDEETMPENLIVTASSSNPDVVSDGNLTITALGDGLNRLRISPHGVGYATITVTASDDTMAWNTSFAYAASAGGGGSSRWHTGVSDASAALPINDDLMFVADDEHQDIRIYNRHLSGLPVSGFDFNAHLNLTDIEAGRPREVDIEGATRVGNRIFWIGSHSHADNSETRTNRGKVFATDISGSGATTLMSFVGYYEHFKADLVSWDADNLHGKGANYYGLGLSSQEGTFPKARDGFNIEGLAMAPGSSTTAYVAFRAPVVPATNRTHALIIPVLNFTSMAISGGPRGTAQIGTPIELDLYGRGIRSIEGNSSGYIIVGGNSGDSFTPYPNNFQLYTWTGNPNDQPVQRAANLTGLNPEAIVELPPLPWTATSPIQLLSDNGRTLFYNDDTIAKRLPEPAFKKFRSDVILLGAPVVPSPIIVSTLKSPSAITLTWRALQGRTYRVQYKASLGDPAWINLPGDVIAPGPFASKTDPTPGSTQRYYQVIAL